MKRISLNKQKREQKIARLVHEESKLVARQLAKNMLLDQKERDLLLKSLLEAPVSDECIPVLCRALIASDAMHQTQGEEILTYLLSYPLTDGQAAVFLDAAADLAGREHGQLTPKRIRALLDALLKQPVPAGSEAGLARAVAGTELQEAERSVLLDALLKKPVPAGSKADLARAAAGADLREAERNVLLDVLLKKPIPAGNRADLARAAAATELQEAERRALLDALLKNPVPAGNESGLAHAVAGLELTGKDRALLLAALLQQPIPAESKAGLARAAADAGLLEAERRILLDVLLKKPIPAGNKADLARAAAEAELPETERSVLLAALLQQSIPTGSVAELVRAAARTELPETERSVLLAALLQQPIPAGSVAELARITAGLELSEEERSMLLAPLLKPYAASGQVPEALQTLADGEEAWRQAMLLALHRDADVVRDLSADGALSKEERHALPEALLKQPIPAESVPDMTRALIKAGMLKDQRVEMLDYVLSRPMTREQLAACMNMLPEAVARGCTQELDAVAKKAAEFQEAHRQLQRWADTKRPGWKENQAGALYRVAFENAPMEEVLLDMVCEGNLCYLKGACIEFIDRKQLWNMMEEILFVEKYYWDCKREAPFILDCGTNIGLAIYYFKRLWPKARVVGFEPWSAAYECVVRNMERNGWSDVVIHNVALDAQAGCAELSTVAENSLAGSLTNRMNKVIEAKGWEKKTEQVQVRLLTDYMDAPVDLLKLDVEGVEDRILRQAEDKLGQVDRIFVEYHYGAELKDNSRTSILTCLERQGFDCEVSRSLAYSRIVRWRPFRHVGQNVSEVIWAVRRDSDG